MSMSWKEVQLDEVLSYEQPTAYIVASSEYSGTHEDTPVLTAGKTFILGYTKEKQGVFESKNPVIIFDDFTTAIKFVDFPFKVKSSAMKILHADEQKADIRYLHYAMQNIHFPIRKHKRHWISEYSKLKVALPPLPEQKRIADKLDKVFAEIEKGSNATSKQREFTSAFRQSYIAKVFSNPEWQSTTLKEHFDIAWGNTSITKKSYVSSGYTAYSAAGADGLLSHYEHEGQAIILSAIGARCGKCFLTEGKWTAIKNTITILPKEGGGVDCKFAWYFLNDESKWRSKGAGQPFITQERANNMTLAVPFKDGKPDLLEQRRVVVELEKAFALADQLGVLASKQEVSFSKLRASALNTLLQPQEAEVAVPVISPIQPVAAPRMFDIQQAVAQILKRFERGEMVVAKVLYLGQTLFGVPTNIQFSAQNFGPYDTAVKKAVTAGLSPRNKFFAKKGSGANQVLTLGTNASKILKYSTSALARKTNAYLDQMLPLFNQSDSAGIERLATLCKIIEDERTADETTVKAKLQEWKPNKFTDEEVSRTLAFIKKQGWDQTLLK